MSSSEKSLLEFSVQLYHKLSTNDKNLVFSPISLSTCLSMVFMGTRGKCAEELSIGLFGKHIKDNEYESVAKELRELNDKCVKSNSNALNVSNLMFTQTEFTVLPQFQQLLQNYFQVMAKSLDFKLRKSVDVINDDIKSATNGKIDKILEEIESNTAMILANALYFKGLWKKQFKKERTQTDVFTTYDNKSLDVQMMYHKSKYPFGYSPQLNARAVELSYENSSAVMVVVLPEDNNSLKQIGDKLTIESLNRLVSSMHTIEVELYLPKFKVESSLELIPPLQDIGIKSVFDPNSADLSGLSHKPGLYVSQVIQKAVIEVSEEGTEAAAATVATIALMSMPITETFKANRPFLYLLVTKNSSKQINSIIFMGECHNPNQ